MIGIYYGGGVNTDTKIVGLQSLDFDATLDELHDWRNEVTQNPVETGTPITDHVIEKADKLRLQGVITNSPLYGEFAGQYFGGDTTSPRIQTAFEAIRELVKSKEAVTVYTSMVIESVSIPRNAQLGEEIQFTMELVNVRLVSTQLVTLPPGISPKKTAKASGAVAKKAEPQKSAGQKEAQPVKQSTSILKSITGAR